MTLRNQLDLFPEETEADLFDTDGFEVLYRPDQDDVRRQLQGMLSELRRAPTMPWRADRVRLFRTIFPQMTLWLPEEEGAQLRFAFDEEMARLGTT